MANIDGWRTSSRGGSSARTPSPDHFGWWAGVAFLAAVVLHACAFLVLGQIQIALGFKDSKDLSTAQARVTQADAIPVDETPPDVTDKAESKPPSADALQETEVLAKIPDQDVDMRPDIKEPQFALSPDRPAASGVPQGLTLDPSRGLNFDVDLPKPGRAEATPLSIAAEGQLAIDPGMTLGADESIDQFTEAIIKKGANGKAPNGALDGVVTLDDMIGLPADVLVGKKTMLPGDLLFEYDHAELRQSAKPGLMKLGLLISRHPDMYCWVEGYSDLFGGDAYNEDLSRHRAESVQHYLTSVLHLPGDRIIPRGFGKASPLVKDGNVEQQAANRRVEIKLRKTPPPAAAPPSQAPQNNIPPPPKAKEANTAGTPAGGNRVQPPARPVNSDPAKNPVLVRPNPVKAQDAGPVDHTPPAPKAKAAPEENDPPHRAVAVPEPVESEKRPLKATPAPEESDEDAPPPKATPAPEDGE